MAVFSYGLKSVKVSDIDAVTGLATSLTDIGKIYRETAEFTEDDPEEFEHYSELDDNPIISKTRKGVKSIMMNLMDTSADNLVKYLGGTVTSVEGAPDKWNEPTTTPEIFKAFEVEMEDGSKYGINRGRVSGKLMPDPKRSGFTVLQLMIKVLQPLVANVPPTYKVDPPAAT
jgi:hypothetical protein